MIDQPQEKDLVITSNSDYDQQHTAQYAKWLHRALIDRALGGRRLISREMLMEAGKKK